MPDMPSFTENITEPVTVSNPSYKTWKVALIAFLSGSLLIASVGCSDSSTPSKPSVNQSQVESQSSPANPTKAYLRHCSEWLKTVAQDSSKVGGLISEMERNPSVISDSDWQQKINFALLELGGSAANLAQIDREAKLDQVPVELATLDALCKKASKEASAWKDDMTVALSSLPNSTKIDRRRVESGSLHMERLATLLQEAIKESERLR